VKRLPRIIFVVLSVSILLAACGPRSAPMKVRIGTDASFPPFEMVDIEKRGLTGFDIELMKAIAAKSGLEVEFVNVSYDQLVIDMAQCRYDGGLSAIIITDELKQKMEFSNPYFAAGQVVVVKGENNTITGRDSLSGKTVGAQKGSSSAAEVEKIAGVGLKTYETFALALQDLIYGVIDAVVADKPLALSYTNNSANNLKIAGDEFAMVNYGIAVCNDRADVLQKINDGIAAVKANGALSKLTQKWIK
jgi:polar amino acid transport system substrate-binding protein